MRHTGGKNLQKVLEQFETVIFRLVGVYINKSGSYFAYFFKKISFF